MIRKIAFSVLGFIALLILTAIIVPFFVDLNSYKGQIQQKTRETIGRDLLLEGPISLSLLPSPSVTMEKVHLSNVNDASTPTMASLEKVRIDVALFPLLTKKLKVTTVQLVKPVIHLQKFRNGSNNWTFTSVVKEENSPAEEKDSKDQSSFDFSFDHIEVIKADIHYKEGKTSHSIKDLTTHLKIEDLKGPLKAEGFLKALDHDIHFDIKVKEIGDKTPVKLELETMGIDLELEGDFVQAEATFQGDLKISGDTKSIEKTFQNKIDVPDFLGEKLSLSGFVKANETSIEIQNLSFVADEEKLTGNFSVALNPLSFSGRLRGLPGQLSLTLSGRPENKGLSGQLELSLASPKKFFAWVDIKPPKNIDFSGLSFTTAFHQTESISSLTSFNGKMGQLHLSGSASYASKNKTARYHLRSAGLETILKAFDIDPGVNLSSIDLKGQTRLADKNQKLTTQTTLDLPGGSVFLDGAIVPEKKGIPTLNLKTETTITDPNTLLNIKSFKGLALKALIKHQNRTLSLENLSASIGMGQGSVSLTGGTSIALAGTPKVTGKLAFSPLNLSKIFPEKQSRQKSSTTSGKNQASPSSPGASRWSSDPIDLSFLNNFKGDFTLSCPSITFRDHVLNNLSAKATLEGGLLEIPALTGQVHGGQLNLGLSVKGGKKSTLKLRSSLDDLSLKRAFSRMQDEKIRLTHGNLDGLINMTTTGSSLRDFISNLDGLVNLKATKGIVDGFDLKNISHKLKSLNTLDAFTNLFKAAMSSGQTRFSEFSLAIAFQKGVGRINKLILIADGGQGHGSGQLNLPRYYMNIATEFRLTENDKLPPFKMTLKGPLDSPEKEFDIGDLEAYLAKNVFKKIIGGVAGGPLGVVVSDLLGNMTEGSPDKSSSDPEKSDKTSSQKNSNPVEDIVEAPAKAVGNLIKGLF